MSFISYVQNYEDVMLRRALKDIDKGLYIDVGANDPIVDSVTKSFYDAGWRGINIEPVTQWFKKLKQDRPHDINLQLAVGANKGIIDFYEVICTGLSTTDESIAKQHAQQHNSKLKEYSIPVVTLTAICEQHPLLDIHFLKINVEGAELAVLQGLDLKKIRPWIILVEATLPNSQIENYDKWEYSITERDYHYVYFDGLNRYYVADEHGELDNAFTAPPNVFDKFRLISEVQAEAKAGQAESKAEQAKAKQTETELCAVYNSSSWKITAPLRWFGYQVRLLRQHGLLSRVKALIKKITQLFIRQVITVIDSHTGLRFWIVKVVRRLGLYNTLRAIYFRLSRDIYTIYGNVIVPKKPQQLTPRAHRIYAELTDAIAKQQKEKL